LTKSALIPAEAPAFEGVDADLVVRSALFLAVFLSAWISFHPFASLAEPPLQITEEIDRTKEIGFSFLFVLLALWSMFHGAGRMKVLLRPVMIATLIWCGLSVLASWQPSLAASRFAVTLGNMGMAAMVLLLPRNTRHFCDLMAAAVLFVLVVCYLGVLLTPQTAVHQATDFLEPEHAGSWRGVFDHKNIAGAVMAQFIFVGLLVARVRSQLLGMTIVVFAAIFMIFAQSKTAIGILPLVLIVSAVFEHTRRPLVTIALAIAVLIAQNSFSVGSVYFEPLHNLIDSIMPDPSFTGRTDIWQFAVQHLAQRPIIGYGFAAFWGTAQVVYGLAGTSNWANSATDAHNDYLDIALAIGIPGLVLVIVLIVVLPLVDYFRARAVHEPDSDPVKLFFLRVCLFAIYASCYETALFMHVGGPRFLSIAAVFGIRYLSVYRPAV